MLFRSRPQPWNQRLKRKTLQISPLQDSHTAHRSPGLPAIAVLPGRTACKSPVNISALCGPFYGYNWPGAKRRFPRSRPWRPRNQNRRSLGAGRAHAGFCCPWGSRSQALPRGSGPRSLSGVVGLEDCLYPPQQPEHQFIHPTGVGTGNLCPGERFPCRSEP